MKTPAKMLGKSTPAAEEPFHAGMPVTPHGTVVTRHISQQAHALEREAEQEHVRRNIQPGLQKSEELAKKKGPTHPGAEGDAKVYSAKGAEKEHFSKLSAAPAPENLPEAQKAFAEQWQSHVPRTKKDAGLRLMTGGEANAKIAKGLGSGPDKGDYYAALLHTSPADLAGGETMCSAAGSCKLTCLNMAGRGGMALDPTDLNKIQITRMGRTKLFKEHPDEFWALIHKDIRGVIAKAKSEGKLPAVRMNGTSDIAWENIRPKEFNGMNVFEAFPEVQFWDYTKRPDRLKANKHQNYNLTFSLDEKNGKAARQLLRDGYNVAAVFGGLATKTKTRKGDALPSRYDLGGEEFNVIDGDDTDFRFLDPRGDGKGEAGKIVGLRAKGDAAFDFTGFTKFDHHAVNPKRLKKVIEKLGFDPRDKEASKHAVSTLLDKLKTKASTTKNIAETDRVQGLVGNRVLKFLDEVRKVRGLKKPRAAKAKAKKSLDKSESHCQYCDRLDNWHNYREDLHKDDPSLATQGVSGATVNSGAASAVSSSFSGSTGGGALDGLADKAANFFKSVKQKKESLEKAKEYSPQKKVQNFNLNGPQMPKVNVPKAAKVPDPSIKIRPVGNLQKTKDFPAEAAAHNAQQKAIKADHDQLVADSQIWNGYKVQKSQYAKTEPSEVREGQRKEVKKNEEKKERINQQLKEEVKDAVATKNGTRYEGLPATPKKTLRSVKDVPACGVTNPPKDK